MLKSGNMHFIQTTFEGGFSMIFSYSPVTTATSLVGRSTNFLSGDPLVLATN